jgi:hypothetical protein
MSDIPLVGFIEKDLLCNIFIKYWIIFIICSPTYQGFGVTARSTVETRKLQPTDIVAFHQADIGEYLREQDTLF